MIDRRALQRPIVSFGQAREVRHRKANRSFTAFHQLLNHINLTHPTTPMIATSTDRARTFSPSEFVLIGLIVPLCMAVGETRRSLLLERSALSAEGLAAASRISRDAEIQRATAEKTRVNLRKSNRLKPESRQPAGRASPTAGACSAHRLRLRRRCPMESLRTPPRTELQRISHICPDGEDPKSAPSTAQWASGIRPAPSASTARRSLR